MSTQRAWTLTIMTLTVFMGIGVSQAIAQVTAEVEWQRCIGGSATEWGSNLSATSDGGFVCVSWCASTDGDAVGSHGGMDILVAKLNADGSIRWKRMLGGSGDESGYSCLEASDGSILVAGSATSNDGDVSGNHGGQDVWVVKLTPDGSIIWQHCYGGSNLEGGGQVLETADGGFLIHSPTHSTDGNVVDPYPDAGQQDHWVFKIDAGGVLLWSRALGGSGADVGGRLINTADGGCLMSFSSTNSDDGDVVGNHGQEDCWLVKLSATGIVEWSRTIGGSERESGFEVTELSNGDLMMLGVTSSSDGDITLNQGLSDLFLARVSSTGELLWLRTYGGTLADDCRTITLTADGGFVLVGSSQSSDGDLTSNAGEQDVMVLKVDATGEILWQRSFGGSLTEWGYSFTSEPGGYLLSGITNSSDGIGADNHGGRDLLFIKLDENGDLVWQRCLGGSAEEWGYVLARANDGGYVACGYTDSNDGDVSGNHGGRDIWVVKVKVNEPTVPPECALYIPTAFSPDSSTKNDTHCLHGTDCIATMRLDIYDRWGNKVFESSDPNICWDGTHNGQPLDPAVFVYHLSAALSNGESVERQGNITLMK